MAAFAEELGLIRLNNGRIELASIADDDVAILLLHCYLRLVKPSIELLASCQFRLPSDNDDLKLAFAHQQAEALCRAIVEHVSLVSRATPVSGFEQNALEHAREARRHRDLHAQRNPNKPPEADAQDDRPVKRQRIASPKEGVRIAPMSSDGIAAILAHQLEAESVSLYASALRLFFPG